MKDLALQRDQTRKRVKRYRNKEKSVTQGSVTEKSVTQYPAVLEAVVDPVKRKKLISICQELRHHNVLNEVRYGYYGPSFDIIEEIISVT